MNPKNCIPKDKSGPLNIAALDMLSDAQLSGIAMNILEWCQDYNWPVAKEVVAFVIDRQTPFLPSILTALNEDDSIWQYWIVSEILPHFTPENMESLIPALSAIEKRPVKTEDDALLREATKILSEHFHI